MVCAYLFGGCNMDGVIAAILVIVVVGLFYSLIEKSKKNIKIIKLKNLSLNGCNGIFEYIKSSKNKYKIEETIVNEKNQCEKGLKNNIVYQISP